MVGQQQATAPAVAAVGATVAVAAGSSSRSGSGSHLLRPCACELGQIHLAPVDDGLVGQRNHPEVVGPNLQPPHQSLYRHAMVYCLDCRYSSVCSVQFTEGKL